PDTLLSFTTTPHPPTTLFPYTTLFRSKPPVRRGQGRARDHGPGPRHADRRETQTGSGSVEPRRGGTVHPDAANFSSPGAGHAWRDRKSTRLNSSHLGISYAVFCLKKKN